MEHLSVSNPQAAGARVTVGEILQQMPLTSRHWMAGVGLFLCFVVEAWEMMIMVLSGDLIKADLHITTAQLGTLLASLYVGMIPGCLIWGRIADAYGRKRTIIWSLILYGISSFASAFAHEYTLLWWARFVAGIFLSGVLVATFVHLEELLPIRYRGRGTVYLAAGWPVGLLLAVGLVHAMRGYGWQVLLAISSLAGLWALVVKWLVPESPYWAETHNREALAIEVLEYLSDGRMTVDWSTLRLHEGHHVRGRFTEVFRRGLLGHTLLQSCVNTTYSFSTWALTAWLPTLLAERGLSLVQSDLFIVLSAVVMAPGYLTASSLTARIGRRKAMFLFLGFAAAGGLAFAFSRTLVEMCLAGSILYFFNQGGWGIWDTWMGELYPTAVRGVGYSIGLTVQRIANAAAPIVIGAMLARHAGFRLTLSFISAFLLLTLLASVFLPETEGVALD